MGGCGGLFRLHQDQKNDHYLSESFIFPLILAFVVADERNVLGDWRAGRAASLLLYERGRSDCSLLHTQQKLLLNEDKLVLGRTCLPLREG